MSGFIIRRATAADAPTLARYNEAMAWETEHLRLDPARVLAGTQSALADPAKGFYLVAEQEGDIVGQLMITYEWSDWRNGVFWWIQSVYVAPAHRGAGVFRALYREVESMAQRQPGVCGLRLYVESDNERAQAAYHRLGMRTTSYRLLEVDFVLSRDSHESPPAP
jgi:ribosomal protein S18 acetylase RimI-like enzyme